MNPQGEIAIVIKPRGDISVAIHPQGEIFFLPKRDPPRGPENHPQKVDSAETGKGRSWEKGREKNKNGKCVWEKKRRFGRYKPFLAKARED